MKAALRSTLLALLLVLAAPPPAWAEGEREEPEIPRSAIEPGMRPPWWLFVGMLLPGTFVVVGAVVVVRRRRGQPGS